MIKVILGLFLLAACVAGESYILPNSGRTNKYNSDVGGIYYPGGSNSGNYNPGGNSYNPASGGSYNPGGSSSSYNPGSSSNYDPYNGGSAGYNPGEPQVNYNQNSVGFSATRADAYTRSTGSSNIVFDRTLTDVGYGWKPQQGVFEAYNPGLYVFSWSSVSPSGSEARVSLFKNGQEEAHSWSDSKGYQSASNQVVLQLRQGDRVSLRVTEGRVFEPTSTYRGYTTFSGYKIN